MELWVGRALVIPSGGGSPGPHRVGDRGCGLCQRGDGSLKQCPGLTPNSCCGHTARAGTGHGQDCHSSLQTEPSNASRARMRPGARLLRSGDCAVSSTARAGPGDRGCLGSLSPTSVTALGASFSVWGPAVSGSAACPPPGAALPHPSQVGWGWAWG